MAAVVFATTAESAVSQTLTFTLNPSFPRSAQRAAPAFIFYRVADGTPYVEQVGLRANVELTWPPHGPMTAADYADLLTFYSATRGSQDEFTFTDDDGDDHEAHFVTGPEGFTEEPHGFAGTLVLVVRS